MDEPRVRKALCYADRDDLAGDIQLLRGLLAEALPVQLRFEVGVVLGDLLIARRVEAEARAVLTSACEAPVQVRGERDDVFAVEGDRLHELFTKLGFFGCGRPALAQVEVPKRSSGIAVSCTGTAHSCLSRSDPGAVPPPALSPLLCFACGETRRRVSYAWRWRWRWR